jgi:type II restriction enzyme
MTKVNVEYLKRMYDQKKQHFGNEAYRHISEILQEVKVQHKLHFKGDDHEQSWRAFKGKNLEKLIEYIIVKEVQSIGLEVINGNSLERTIGANLPRTLGNVKRNLLIDYGEFGSHLPDVDIIIYNPANSRIIAVLSCKVTLRERIAQTGYWKLKLASDEITKHIKVYFVTPDEDGALTTKYPHKKARAIVEKDLDGSYVLSEAEVEESNKVKMFDKLIADLRLLQQNQ